jgi:hypothetical protein
MNNAGAEKEQAIIERLLPCKNKCIHGSGVVFGTKYKYKINRNIFLAWHLEIDA